MSVMHDFGASLRAGRLVEAKKILNPANFVPVFDWDDTHIWLWVQKPGGKVVGPVQMSHGNVTQYAGKLGWLPQSMEYRAQLDPDAYSSPVDLYPATWTTGDPVPTEVPEKSVVKGKYAPPVVAKATATSKLPPEFTLTGTKDPNGFPTAEDEGSGETYSILPDGRFGAWKASEGVYYIVKKEDGEWDIHLDSPIYTPAELKPKTEPEPVAAPPEFSLPPNHTIKKVTKTYVTVTTPDGKDVKWIKVTGQWVHADDPKKEYIPLQAAAVPPPPPKPSKPTTTAKAAPKPPAPAAVPPASAPPAPQPAFQGVPSTTEPKPQAVVATSPEPAPHLTKYTGKVDVNGFPMVDEIGEGDDEDQVAVDLTLLPDDRVAKWQPSGSYYLLYDYHPHFGFMYSKKGETTTAEEMKALMGTLHLTVKNAKYHKVSSVGAAPDAEQPAYQTPLPPHTEAVETKDSNGLPMVKSIPSEEDDQHWPLTLFPNSTVGKWNPMVKKYNLWTWSSIMGCYNYFPTHPSQYISMKEVRKLQALAKAGAGAPTPAATKSVPQPAAKAPPPKAPVIPPPATPEVTPPKKAAPPIQPGVLLPLGKKDAKGYDLGSYHGKTFTMLPDNKVGIWSEENGAYFLYAYDALNDSFYNTAMLWTPPGSHRSLAYVSPVTVSADLAVVADYAGTSVSVLPNGKFAKQVDWDFFNVYKADPTKGKLFEPTGQKLTSNEVQALAKTPEYKSMKPTGRVDPNGLPLFSVNVGNKELTMLPNGDLAKWREDEKKYRQYQFDAEVSVWSTSIPIEYFTLDDISAMYLKAGAEPVASVMQTPVEQPPIEKPAVLILPATLKLTGGVDSNGYPAVEPYAEPGKILTFLPNGEIAKWQKTAEVYVKLEYDEEGLFWWMAEPSQSWTLDEVKAMGAPAVPGTPPPPEMPEPAPAVSTPIGKFPSLDSMQYLGSGKSLGYAGAGDKEIFQDPKTGQKYIFKLAAPKGGGKAVPYKVASQQGFATIAELVRPDAYVPVEAMTYKGKLGTLQPELKTSPKGNLKGTPPTELNSQQKVDVASEHMLDWLMSQHDSFSANLIVTAEGRIVGVDKEQGWRYVDDAKQPDRLATDYAPNSVNYGEEEPYYNKFWKAFAAGKLDFDPQEMLPTLKKIEAIPPKEFEQVLESCVNSRSDLQGPEKTYERYRFIKKMLSRRATLRADFEKFITAQYDARTGKADGKFTFATGWIVPGEDEGPKWQEMELSVRDYALQELGTKALKPHKDNPEWVLVRISNIEPITKMQEFLAGMGVEPVDPSITPNPLFGSQYNSIVVKSIDLDKIFKKMVEIKKDPGQKFANYLGVPTYFSAALAPEDAPGAIDDLPKAAKDHLGPLGKNFTLDANAVEQQTMSVQRVMDTDGKTYFVAHFKLRQPFWEAITGGTSGSYTWPLGAYDKQKDALVLSSYQSGAFEQPATIFSFPGGDQLAILGHGSEWAFKGSVYATIHGEDVNVRSVLEKMLQKIGLDTKVMKNPGTEDIEVYNMVQALWSLDPKAHAKLTQEDFAVPVLTKKLKKVLTKDQIKSVRQVRGTAGRGSPIVPGLWKTLGGGTPEKPVVRFLFWTVNTTSVTKILKSAATGIHERLRMGLGTGIGTSETSDMHSGGADATTVRLATVRSKNIGVSGIGSVSREVKLIIAPEVLDRLDVHISLASSVHSGDSYGCTNLDNYSYGYYFKNRKGLSKDVEAFDQGSYHSSSNEVILRRGVPADMIKRICVAGESYRKEILEKCEAAGIIEHNGCPIEDFIVVDDNQDTIYNKYLKPLGY